MNDEPRLRFRAADRLRRSSEVQRCLREGNRARGRDLIVVVRANEGERSRLGLSIGKRIWKRAVRRNRVRRVFREAFRLSLPELPRGVDVVLIPARPALWPKTDEVARELVPLVRKALARYRAKRAELQGREPAPKEAAPKETAPEAAPPEADGR